ncbi:MAG: tRNA uridine-5-carboxymethylaminomethyl(34) synthesis GTPase MnmE [Deltaproteobacteria bacterium]|jgi:tRNA modification GTPase|nr:MAG: tRNA uridine-5-carboxymethylaminomethyl(34) synthesis GTPase MnmE [Deltaproteobacteria bacterium]
MYEQDTIAAIATPPGEGGVAIVRISGIGAENIAAKIFCRAHGKSGKFETHRLYHGKIRDPMSERVLDEVLLTIMRKPRSYTGEDVVEIHGHGGAFLIRQILRLVLTQGARQAEPGEFTKRAFLNGRLDLAQAEAVLDLIRARTEKSAGLALDQTSGALSRWVDELREELLDILVQVEAAIDFPEEEIELLRRQELIGRISGLSDKLSYISDTYDWGKLFREGAKVCICGRPNVGKSSLLNALLGEDRVIVTPVAGTTRDVIEESINLAGLPIVLWDTAGIHETDDQIERMGVDLARRHMDKSDAVIVVLDGSQQLTPDDEALLECASRGRVLVAINKSDLPQSLVQQKLTRFRCSKKIGHVSAKTGAGISWLKESLRDLILGSEVESPVVITNLRHRSALQRGQVALEHATMAASENYASEFIAVDLNEAREALEEITGLINNEDILERIFSNFCIGK